MPWDEVMHKFKAGKLHSGDKHGPKVKDRRQAIAIMLSEKGAAKGGKEEYQSKDSKPMEGLKKAHK
jgi:hypothetical protein